MEWIKCTDRLPSKENENIVCLINGQCILANVHDATFTLTNGVVSFFWPRNQWVNDRFYGKVTHWMPVPKPPEE